MTDFNIMQMVDCIICHGPVRVPVKIKAGFACETKKARGGVDKPCNAILRACVTCVRTYLQLHLPSSQREVRKKCLVCPETINLQMLRDSASCYEKDYLLMSLDSCTDYGCFHEALGCSFKGGQNDLDHHLQNDCEFRKMWCSCGTVYIAGEAQKHKETCPHYLRCLVGGCTTYVRTNGELYEHLRQEHGVIRCCHMDCQELLPIDEYEDHIKLTCLSRRVTCEDCNRTIRATCFKNHLMQHVNEENDRIQQALSRIERFTGLYRKTT